MVGKSTDHKGKGKETKSATNELTDKLGTFTLPDSLPCSEVDFPILIKKKTKASWKQILEESEQTFEEIERYEKSKKEPIPKSPFLINENNYNCLNCNYRNIETECDYIQNEVFVHLIPAVEKTLNKAKIWDALRIQKCFFNGIDHIVQVLWNNNPRYPDRKRINLHLFNMPWVRDYLTSNPRPYYPKSWLWPENYAATVIQKTVRKYFVQREGEVQEMREFWRKLEIEQGVPDMDTNPFLAKKFASVPTFHQNM